MSGGLKYDSKKPDFSLIPVAALIEEAALWTDGEVKYAAFNWHQGLMYRRILAAIDRHYNLLKAGIDFDSETKRHHAAAIRCGCAMLIQFCLEGRTDLDNRMQLSEETKNKIERLMVGESMFDLLKELSNAPKAEATTYNYNPPSTTFYTTLGECLYVADASEITDKPGYVSRTK